MNEHFFFPWSTDTDRTNELAQRLNKPTVEHGLEVQYGETGFTLRRTPDNRFHVRLTEKTPFPLSGFPTFYSWIQVRLTTQEVVETTAPIVWTPVEGGMWGNYDGTGMGAALESRFNDSVPVDPNTGTVVEIRLERSIWVFDYQDIGEEDVIITPPPNSEWTFTDVTWYIDSIFQGTGTGSDIIGTGGTQNLPGLGINIQAGSIVLISGPGFLSLQSPIDICGPLYSCYADVDHDTDGDLDLLQNNNPDNKPAYQIIGAGADTKIYGIIPNGGDQRLRILHNGSAFTYILIDESPDSGLASRRFWLPNQKDYHLLPQATVWVWYHPMVDRYVVWADSGRALGARSVSSNPYNVTCEDLGNILDCTSALTINLPPGSTARPGFYFYVRHNISGGGDITLDGSGIEAIDQQTTRVMLSRRDIALVMWTGSEWCMLPAITGQANSITPTYTRRRLNLIGQNGVDVTIGDGAADDRINYTFSANLAYLNANLTFPTPPVTIDSDEAVLGSDYTVTASFASTGLTITLPAAGDYIIEAEATGSIQVANSTGGVFTDTIV